MSDLTEFLLTRIAEDEALAKAAQEEAPTPWADDGGTLDDANRRSLAGYARRFASPHMARHDPARVLVECEAKRQVVEMDGNRCGCADGLDADEFERDYGFRPAEHYPNDYAYDCDGCAAAQTADHDHDRVLRILASVYADHPDYRSEWRPGQD